MSIVRPENRKELQEAVKGLQPGDCVQVGSFAGAAANARELLSAIVKIADAGADFVSLEEGIDTRGEEGARFVALCRAFAALDKSEQREKQRDGINKAREDGKYKGRKPIAVDEDLFEAAVALWKSGQISARQAMAQLDLKPNTFYRRIKEREEQTRQNARRAGKELRSELREVARQSCQDLEELKKQVRAGVRELKKHPEEGAEPPENED